VADSFYKTQHWYRMAKSNVARILRVMRTIEGATQQDLAKAALTQQSSISELEKGEVDTQITTLLRYAEACGFDVEIRFIRKPGLTIQTTLVLKSEEVLQND